jgi:hypothetical protein
MRILLWAGIALRPDYSDTDELDANEAVRAQDRLEICAQTW